MNQMRILVFGLTLLLVGALSGLPSSDWSIGVWTTSASAGEKGTKSMSTLQKISPQGKKQLLRAAPGDSAAANYHCAPGAPFSGRTYYVSPSGDDSNAGISITMPWRTVNRVNQQKFGPCDKVLFEGPKLYEGGIILEPPRCGGLPGKPIMISSWGSGRAILEAGSNTGIDVHNCGAIQISNIQLVGSGVLTNSGHGILFRNSLAGDIKLSHVVIDQVEIQGFRKGGITINGLMGQSGYRNVRITGSHLHDNGQHGIASRGMFLTDISGHAHENFYVAHNRVRHNLGDPANTTSHTGNGIVLGGVDQGLIEYNVANHNGALNVSRVGGPVGIWVWDSSRIVVQFNESHHNRSGSNIDGGGFDFDGGTTNSIMQYNYSHDNEGAGFLIYQFPYARSMKSNVVRYNISENDAQKYGAGIWFNSGYQCPPGAPSSPLDCEWSTVENVAIYNNTVFVGATMRKEAAAFRASGTAHNNVLVSNNLFVNAGTDNPIVDIKDKNDLFFHGNNYYPQEGRLRISYHGKQYFGLKTWRAETNQEMLDNRATGLSEDPRLKSPGRGGTVANVKELQRLRAYQLHNRSPMIDAGLDLAKVFNLDPGGQDFFGTPLPQREAYDIGAYEASASN